jgi:multiple sugar transport system permease protein
VNVATSTLAVPPIRRRWHWSRVRRKSAEVLTVWAPIGLFAFISLFPFYWMAVTSVKPNIALIDLKASQFWVESPTLIHYEYLFQRTLYLRWLFNTLFVSFTSVFIALLIAVPASYALARLRFWGAGAMGLAIGVAYLVPQSLLFLPMFDVVRALNIGNTYLALILPYQTILVPFVSFLLIGYFKTIPRELEECALIDGSGRIGAIVHIALPLAAPGILSAALFAFTACWNEYLYALVFTSTSSMKTVPIGVVNELIRGDVYAWGSLMAGAVLGSVPVAIIYSLLADYYVKAMTAGAVKG